ncbi:type II toxin-antitoxin system Phd/YefM family antitoxin [Planobispora siamensis]|uniref:Antitoxin n=1 Tax=Planobispora siamensis TaxID=936338 RepID=A0A8J3WN13_9ACTN|nr:type II toxin-antitoxin system Phd/YefM family antitoxin [Planobispora siamensis]GIH95255.1 hypothetical protein Psi01_58850 [Planobispora siamensis]
MSSEPMGVADARKQLGTLIARAVHRHTPTVISRSTHERAVIISEEDYRDLVALRRAREEATVAKMIADTDAGTLPVATFDDPADVYAAVGLTPSPGR